MSVYYGLLLGSVRFEVFDKVMFGVLLCGSNMLFFPMHFTGLNELPRRVVDYSDCYWFINSVSSIGIVVVVGYIILYYSMCGLCLQNTSVYYNECVGFTVLYFDCVSSSLVILYLLVALVLVILVVRLLSWCYNHVYDISIFIIQTHFNTIITISCTQAL